MTGKMMSYIITIITGMATEVIELTALTMQSWTNCVDRFYVES